MSAEERAQSQLNQEQGELRESTPMVPRTVASGDEWYVKDEEGVEGPVRMRDLLAWVKDGDLKPTELVRRGKESSWVNAGDVKPLAELFGKRAELSIEQKSVEDQRLPRIVNSREYIEDGYRILRTLNVVSARCVYGANVWKDFKAAVRDLVGGRSKTSEKLLRDTENELIRTLRLKAQKLGADALVEYRVQFGQMGGGGGNMFYGTAQATPVVLTKIDPENGGEAE